jgi:hypothetical protein
MRKLIKISFYSLLFTTVLFSCRIKYSTGSEGTLPENIKTFSIEQFTNSASLGPSTIGFTFTENLRDLFQSQTKLELISTDGDLSYEGNISSYTVQPISIQGNQTAAQNRLTITVKISFVNQKQEGKNFEQSFTRFADFSSSSSLSTVENDLITEIFEQITQDIYNKTLGDW